MKMLNTLIVSAALSLACNPSNTGSTSATNTSTTTQQTQDTGSVFAVISPSDFSQKLTQKPGILLDVRTPGEHKKGFIEGARLLDIFSDNFDTELAKLDRNTIYYVYCASGGRSAECVEKMQAMGFKTVFDLDGGMGAWRNAGLPVTMPKP